MYRIRALAHEIPANVANVGTEIRSRKGIHVTYDTPYYHYVQYDVKYMKGPVKPFVGMSFAALVYYDHSPTLMSIALGHTAPLLELSQVQDKLDIYYLNKDGANWRSPTAYPLNLRLGDFVWYEITINEPNTYKVKVNGIEVRQFASISDATFVTRLDHHIRFHHTDKQNCSFLEFHWTVLDPQYLDTLFDATKRYYINSFHTNKKAIFTGVDACTVSESGSITISARSEERNPSVGMKLGFAKEPSDENRFVTLSSALDKNSNLILIRAGFVEYSFYCNKEKHLLKSVYPGEEYLVIRDNCEPYDIDVHCGAKTPAAS